MAEDLCCEIFEAKVVADLCRPHKRADPKLTPTERARLTSTFNKAWTLLVTFRGNPESANDGLEKLSAKDTFYVLEVVTFLHNNVANPELRQMARLQGESLYDDTECRDSLAELLRLVGVQLGKKNPRGFNMPEKAPLGLFAMFDHWQDDYMEQFE